MKTYLRLFAANPVTRYGAILLLVSFFILVARPDIIYPEFILLISYVTFLSSSVALGASLFGLDALRHYRSFMKAHFSGKKKITEWSDCHLPCGRAAMKLARKDIEKIEAGMKQKAELV